MDIICKALVAVWRVLKKFYYKEILIILPKSVKRLLIRRSSMIRLLLYLLGNPFQSFLVFDGKKWHKDFKSNQENKNNWEKNDCEKMDNSWLITFLLTSFCVLKKFEGLWIWNIVFSSVARIVVPGKISSFLAFYVLRISFGVHIHVQEAVDIMFNHFIYHGATIP